MSSLRLLLVFGGASSEHEISIRSARSVLAALDRERFVPVPVGIRRDGTWRSTQPGQPDTELEAILEHGREIHDLRALEADLVFPVLHGPYGEDGTIQGLLEILGLPYVGSGVQASAVCMDKATQKHVIASAAPHVPLVPWCEVRAAELHQTGGLERIITRVARQLGLPCFVKPANMGSSVGVVRVEHTDQLPKALAEAARYDHRLVVEQGIDAREIEIAVLGNGGSDTQLSAPGEISLPEGVWYDYETKYLNDVATLHIPAELPADTADTIRKLAHDAFVAVGCSGLARIDFLLDRHSGTPYLNELNTMPGFTSISMYPKLMEHAGVPYRQLITRLCELGLGRHNQRRTLSNAR